MPNVTSDTLDSVTEDEQVESLETVDPGSAAEEASQDGAGETTTTPIWKKLIAVGAWLMAVFFLYALIGSLRQEPATAPSRSPVSLAAAPAAPPPSDSLGIRFDEVRELWNSLDRPPSITQSLRRSPENGQFDSFRHSFDALADLTGAYDPENDYLVALMVRSNLAHPDVSNMYLHLCQMIHPFSPECIDNYFTNGLDGQTLEDLGKAGRDATWVYEGNEWRVTVADNLLTLRVLAPGSG